MSYILKCPQSISKCSSLPSQRCKVTVCFSAVNFLKLFLILWLLYTISQGIRRGRVTFHCAPHPLKTPYLVECSDITVFVILDHAFSSFTKLYLGPFLSWEGTSCEELKSASLPQPGYITTDLSLALPRPPNMPMNIYAKKHLVNT